MLVCTEPFEALAAVQASALGADGLRTVVLPHPLRTFSHDELVSRGVAETGVAQVVELLERGAFTMSGDGQKEVADAGNAGATWEVEPGWDSWMQFIDERRWGDGFPMVEPTRERVAELVRASGCSGDEVVGRVPPLWRVLRIRDVAVNGVLAGLPPAGMPVVVAAMRGLLDDAFNLHAVQATTNPAAPIVVACGPAAVECGMESGYGCLGPGWRANATIGRTIRLVLLHVGGARPGELDRATMGQPAKFGLAFAEAEDRSPWPNLATDRGLSPGTSAVTTMAVCCLVNHLDNSSTRPADLLDGMARSLAYYGANPLHTGGETLVILSPEHAEILAREIETKEELRSRLWERAVVPRSDFTDEALKLMLRRRVRHEAAVSGAEVHVLDQPDDLLVVVAGGDGLHTMICPSLGPTRAVTTVVGPP